jgi:hypothetical protein
MAALTLRDNRNQSALQQIVRHSIGSSATASSAAATRKLAGRLWVSFELDVRRLIDPLPTLSACPLRSDRDRTFAPQQIDAVCHERP